MLGEIDVPIPAGLNGVIGIAGGRLHSLALRADGSVVAWGQAGPMILQILNGFNSASPSCHLV